MESARAVVAAIVPAKDCADRIDATIHALRRVERLDRIIVVDDGSSDETATCAAQAFDRDAGADADARCVVVQLAANVGKGGAVTAGLQELPDADIVVLIDADLGASAEIAASLIEPLLRDEADLSIAVPTASAGARGGLGLVRGLAANGIRRACGFETTTPLSGQRAVRAQLLREVTLADRFGLETAMTIDLVRAGARVREIPVAFEHRHMGRSLTGFSHRARQGVDIVRALWPRLTTPSARRAVVLVPAVVMLLAGLVTANRWEPRSSPGAQNARKVVIFGFTRLGLDDIASDAGEEIRDALPTLRAQIARGTVAGMSVRTVAGRPTTVEGYATIGAGARVRARDAAADAFLAGDEVGLLTASDVLATRTGAESNADVLVVGMPETIAANERRYLPSLPGALGDALRAAGRRTAVINSSDTGFVGRDPNAGRQRPAAVAVADSNGSVDAGVVGASLLEEDRRAPFGVRVANGRFLAAVDDALAKADVIVVDPGEMDRAFAYRADASEEQAESLRVAALRRTDSILSGVLSRLAPDDLLIVVSVRPPTSKWELTPIVMVGGGLERGELHSPSTRRRALVTLTDVAPTVLAAIGVETPDGMIGHPLRVRRLSSGADVDAMRDVSRLATYRERIYLPLTKGYVIVQTLVYLLAIFLFSGRLSLRREVRTALSWVVLVIAAWPLATFVFRMIPRAWIFGPFALFVMLGIDLLIVALARRSRRHPLSALSVVLFLTIALNVIDLLTGAHLQQSSILGYSPHTAARFTGIGNAAFAALASTTVLWSAIHVQYAPRRREALWTVAAVCGLVLVADGAPMLGSDVGGILTLVPTFGLLLYALSGRKVRPRLILLACVATFAVLALATGLDLLRPATQRTHLGRLASDVFSGDRDAFTTTIGRKVSTNVRVFTRSFWTWIVPVIAIVLLFFLGVKRGWERDMPRGSALRVGVAAALLCGLLGFAMNDSGSVVTALVFVYLGPFIVLLAAARRESAASSPSTDLPLREGPQPT